MTKLRAVVMRRWPILLATLVLGVIAGALSADIGVERPVTIYQADQVVVANRVAGNPASVPQDALKVVRGEVPRRAAEILGRPRTDSTQLAREVLVSPKPESNSITIRVTDADPERASEVVQAFAQAFVEVINSDLRSEDTQQLERIQQRVAAATADLEAFDAQYGFLTRSDVELPKTPAVDSLLAERSRLVNAQTQAQTELNQFELSVTRREPYSSLGPERPKVADAQLIEVPDSPLFRAGLLGGIGLLLGVGLVLVIERVNQRIDTREELAELISVPIVAEIGRIPARQRHRDGTKVSLDGVWSEHYRRVRSAIQFVQADAEARASVGTGITIDSGASAVIAGHRTTTGSVPRVFLFASALPGEGKSTSVALTALALAETGADTLVVNADFRRPKVESYLGTRHSPSLADRAELSIDRPDVEDVVVPTEFPHLYMAASGPPTLEVGGRLTAARELAAEAAASGGTVLIDSSPLRVSNDPIDLLSAVDEVILVVRAGRTTVKSIEDTMELLAMHHAPVLGVILIGTLATREMYAYYQSYYRRASETDEAGAAGGDDVGGGHHGGLNGSAVVPNGVPSPHAPPPVPPAHVAAPGQPAPPPHSPPEPPAPPPYPG